MTMGPSVDVVILLAPLALLAVVALLGFAGCEFTPGKAPPPPPPPTPTLTFRARVPTELTVIRVTFAWQSPSTPRAGVTVMTASGADGADNLFEHTLMDPAPEAWTSRCDVEVQGGPAETPFANGPFMLDGSIEDPVATFQGTGPAAQLIVTYIGTG